MFYPHDYEVKRLKEQEMRERLQQAAKDQLLYENLPHRPGILSRLARQALHLLGHGLTKAGHRLDQLDPLSTQRPQPRSKLHGTS